MFGFQAAQFNFVGLVLRLLLQPASPRGQLVFLFSRGGSHIEGQLAHRRHVVNDPAQLVEFLADVEEFPRVGGQIVTVA